MKDICIEGADFNGKVFEVIQPRRDEVQEIDFDSEDSPSRQTIYQTFVRLQVTHLTL